MHVDAATAVMLLLDAAVHAHTTLKFVASGLLTKVRP